MYGRRLKDLISFRGLQQHLDKRIKKLEEWREQLANPRCGPRSVASAKKQIDAMLSGQHLKKVLQIEYDPDRYGSDRVRYRIDEEARAHLENEEFGKRILVTDRSDWSDEEILLAYRGQSNVEDAFRQLKDDEHMAVRPQYHWTDQKIHVHTFCCLLALLLGRVIELEARKLRLPRRAVGSARSVGYDTAGNDPQVFRQQGRAATL